MEGKEDEKKEALQDETVEGKEEKKMEDKKHQKLSKVVKKMMFLDCEKYFVPPLFPSQTQP